MGTRVVGKWTGTAFQVERPLGVGANGQVYLVRTPNGRAAMKVCERSADIALEWAHLEKLSPSNHVFPRPMIIDDAPPNTYFYVMEWVPGEPLDRVLPGLATPALVHVMEQVVEALAALHATGHAFCDLKPENILVSAAPSLLVRFVDVGGITPFGRSVRQFTPYYDRAFWGLGSRRADASYDLCACALCALLAKTGLPPSALVNRRPEERRAWLEKSLKRFPDGRVADLLRNALYRRVQDARSFGISWHDPTLLHPRSARQTGAATRGSSGLRRSSGARGSSLGGSSAAPHPATGRVRAARPSSRHRDWTEWLMWVSLGTAATVTLTAWATFLGWFG